MPPRIHADDPTVRADWRDLVGHEAATNTDNWVHYKKIAVRLADRVEALEQQLRAFTGTVPVRRTVKRPRT